MKNTLIKHFNIKEVEKKRIDNNIMQLISMEYTKNKDNYTDKDVKKAYNQFKRELISQYRIIKKYIKIEYTSYNPYETSQLMFEDIKKNKRLKVFNGGEYHKSMKKINVIFRAVHDILGQYIGNASFSLNGEYKAFLHHWQVFSPLARKALFTETIGQICYYNVTNKYADQKSFIFKDHFINMV